MLNRFCCVIFLISTIGCIPTVRDLGPDMLRQAAQISDTADSSETLLEEGTLNGPCYSDFTCGPGLKCYRMPEPCSAPYSCGVFQCMQEHDDSVDQTQGTDDSASPDFADDQPLDQ